MSESVVDAPRVEHGVSVKTPPEETADRLARRAFFSFLLTFMASRTVVVHIMSDRIPNLYLFLKDTHVHHLNYGIFLLAIVAAYVIFRRPTGRRLEWAALVYGFAMGLTFDEFGMWLHLGGSYWQRASVDAVLVVAAVIGFIAFAPPLKRLRAHHHMAFVILIAALVGFSIVLYIASKHLGDVVGSSLRELESRSSH
jgi:hypothetical protein